MYIEGLRNKIRLIDGYSCNGDCENCIIKYKCQKNIGERRLFDIEEICYQIENRKQPDCNVVKVCCADLFSVENLIETFEQLNKMHPDIIFFVEYFYANKNIDLIKKFVELPYVKWHDHTVLVTSYCQDDLLKKNGCNFTVDDIKNIVKILSEHTDSVRIAMWCNCGEDYTSVDNIKGMGVKEVTLINRLSEELEENINVTNEFVYGDNKDGSVCEDTWPDMFMISKNDMFSEFDIVASDFRYKAT